MSKELDKVREIFLTDVDDETREENLKVLEEWETGLRNNQAMASWQGHDITKQVAMQAKEAYKEAGIMLATRRDLTDEQRHRLWGQQDAAAWLISMVETDAVAQLNLIRKQIRDALKVT